MVTSQTFRAAIGSILSASILASCSIPQSSKPEYDSTHNSYNLEERVGKRKQNAQSPHIATDKAPEMLQNQDSYESIRQLRERYTELRNTQPGRLVVMPSHGETYTALNDLIDEKISYLQSNDDISTLFSLSALSRETFDEELFDKIGQTIAKVELPYKDIQKYSPKTDLVSAASGILWMPSSEQRDSENSGLIALAASEYLVESAQEQNTLSETITHYVFANQLMRKASTIQSEIRPDFTTEIISQAAAEYITTHTDFKEAYATLLLQGADPAVTHIKNAVHDTLKQEYMSKD